MNAGAFYVPSSANTNTPMVDETNTSMGMLPQTKLNAKVEDIGEEVVNFPWFCGK